MTKSTIAIFQISTEEDLRFQIDFVGLDLAGRTLKVNVRRRDTNALVQALTAPTNITLAGSGNVTVFYPRASMTAWAKTEYEADILDETGGSATRIMAVRFVYDEPGKLVYGVRGNQATVTFAENQATVTAIGGVGPPGPANVLTIGDVTAVAFGGPAAVRINGAAPTQELEFDLPRGAQGPPGTIEVVKVNTGAPGSSVAIVNVGTPEAAKLEITIPRGDVGKQGDKGWSPLFAVVEDGARRVLRVVDWTGGEGTEPSNGQYLGPAGLVATAAEATNFRGEPGAAVAAGGIGTNELADKAVTEAKVGAAFLDTILRGTDLAKLTPRTSASGASVISSGTTAERPVTPVAGYIRWNESTSEYEGGNGTAWVPIGGGGTLVASTPPTTNLREGLLWFNDEIGVQFVYLVDGDSGQWISAYPVIDPSLFFLKGDALAGIAGDAALANLGANANGRDILKGATAIGKLLGLATDEVAGRAAINVPPLPKTSSGVGEFVAINTSSGAAAVLPAGGTWAYCRFPRQVSNGLWAGGAGASVAAGGTTIAAATADVIWCGFAWRIS